jgi:DME family drug/metabolite transporter
VSGAPQAAGNAAGLLAIAAAAVLWGLLGPTARVVLQAGVTPLELAFWRAALAALLFGAHAAGRGGPGLARRDAPAVLLLGVAGVAVFYASYLMAVRTGGAALAAVLLYTAPAWVAVGGRLWLDEPVTRHGAATIVLGIAGVALVATAGSATVAITPPAVAWGLLAGLTYALYYLLGRRLFVRHRAELVLAAALAVGAVVLLPFVRFAPKSPLAWAAIVGIAVVPTYLAYLLYAWGLRRVAAARAATVATLEPVVAVAAAWVAWGEVLRPAAYVGAALVVLAVVASAAAPRDAAPARAPAP